VLKKVESLGKPNLLLNPESVVKNIKKRNIKTGVKVRKS